MRYMRATAGSWELPRLERRLLPALHDDKLLRLFPQLHGTRSRAAPLRTKHDLVPTPGLADMQPGGHSRFELWPMPQVVSPD
jgi:hypothetical protein